MKIMLTDDEKYMKAAICEARKAAKLKEVPIGCVIVYQGKIIARGYNKRNTKKNTLAHAEMIAINKASKAIGDWRLEGCTMYVTLEPCSMCAGALIQSRIDRVVIGAMNAKAGCAGSVMNILGASGFNHKIDITYDILREECSRMMSEFFSELRQRLKEEKKMKVFPEIKGKLGFGGMRFPMKGKEVDTDMLCKMIDIYMGAGFNYFDTAHNYIDGRSEPALKQCLVDRYKREEFVYADKLTTVFFHKEEDIRPLFSEQLEAAGLEYFDFYLMHSLNTKYYKKYKKCRAFETAFALKEEGKIRHVGISFHDRANVLEEILTDYPRIEFVQIQLNYIDYEDKGIEARKVYEVCVKHNKPVIIMEPNKGGALINIPEDAQKIFDAAGSCSNAGYAMRFAGGFENVVMVLSGMSTEEQVRDNIETFKDFKPLSDREMQAVSKVCEIIKAQNLIQCTGCRYCMDKCPKGISIPELFADLNAKKQYKDWNSEWYYTIHTMNTPKASECLGCGLCEEACPQHLEIRELLNDVADTFEKN